jgi:hypothetical protein
MTTNNHQGGATRRGGFGSTHEAQPRAAKPKSPQQRRKSPGRRRGGCNDARAPQAFKVKSAAAQITQRLREGVNLIVVRRPVGAAGCAIQRPFSWIVKTKARGHEKVAAADEDEKRTGSTTFQTVLYKARPATRSDPGDRGREANRRESDNQGIIRIRESNLLCGSVVILV